MNKKIKKAVKKSIKNQVGKKVTAIKKQAVKKSKSFSKLKMRSVKKAVTLLRVGKQNKPIGTVTHFYGHIKVAIVKFKKDVRVGTNLRYRGATTNFVDLVKSMQFNHEAVKLAKKNKQIGIKVKKMVRQGDKVYLEK